MSQKLVIHNEVVKVKGRVKVITIKKDEFQKFLQLRKLRILDKEYEALMPPIDSLQKNTIDVNGLATIIQQNTGMTLDITSGFITSSPAQIILTTSGGNVTLSYNNGISPNSQGVTVYMQVFQESSNYTFQYYYIAFDTTNSSYSVSELELYASVYGTSLARIAYASSSFTKTSDSYLFITWLIEFQNIPPYLVPFTPIFQNNVNVYTTDDLTNPDYYTVYFNNNNCNFTCGGDCPSVNLNSFIVNVQNNTIILEFPVTVPLQGTTSDIQLLLCIHQNFNNMPNISAHTSTKLAPPVSGGIFYAVIATIEIIYQVS